MTTQAYKWKRFILYFYSETASTKLFFGYFAHNVRRKRDWNSRERLVKVQSYISRWFQRDSNALTSAMPMQRSSNEATQLVVSFAAVFWMSRNAPTFFGGSVAWHPKNCCEGDYSVGSRSICWAHLFPWKEFKIYDGDGRRKRHLKI